MLLALHLLLLLVVGLIEVTANRRTLKLIEVEPWSCIKALLQLSNLASNAGIDPLRYGQNEDTEVLSSLDRIENINNGTDPRIVAMLLNLPNGNDPDLTNSSPNLNEERARATRRHHRRAGHVLQIRSQIT
jgi:hypothetical protein